ncbi:uncharacterized protein WCC33_011368 [Rhinophrynus dorsalis]
MTKAFSSVEWLAQSSRIPRTQRTSKVDTRFSQYPNASLNVWTSDASSPFSWNPQSSQYTSSSHLPSCQENTELSPYPESAHVSPYSPDSDVSIYSHESESSPYKKDTKASPCLRDNGLSPRVQENPAYSRVCPTMEPMYGNAQNLISVNRQEIPTPTMQSSEDTKQIGSKQDPAHSGCSTSADSGYESETSRSSSTTPEADAVESSNEASDEEGKMGRRLRTAFTSDQISTLEKTFQKHRYLGAVERRKLAAKLRLSEVQIKTWFQNRRMKYKREIQDGRPDPFHPAQFFNVYGYPQQHSQAIPQSCAVYTPIVDAIPASIPYPIQASSMDSLNAFNSQTFPLMYLPQQSFAQSLGYQEERPFVRY